MAARLWDSVWVLGLCAAGGVEHGQSVEARARINLTLRSTIPLPLSLPSGRAPEPGEVPDRSTVRQLVRCSHSMLHVSNSHGVPERD